MSASSASAFSTAVSLARSWIDEERFSVQGFAGIGFEMAFARDAVFEQKPAAGVQMRTAFGLLQSPPPGLDKTLATSEFKDPRAALFVYQAPADKQGAALHLGLLGEGPVDLRSTESLWG